MPFSPPSPGVDQGVDQGALWRSLDKARGFFVVDVGLTVKIDLRDLNVGKLQGAMVVKVTRISSPTNLNFESELSEPHAR